MKLKQNSVMARKVAGKISSQGALPSGGALGDQHAPGRSPSNQDGDRAQRQEQTHRLIGQREKAIGLIKSPSGLVFGIDHYGMDRNLLAGVERPLDGVRQEEPAQASP